VAVQELSRDPCAARARARALTPPAAARGAALGFAGGLALEAERGQPALAAPAACGALEALLGQRSRDAAAAGAAAERLAAARSEAAVAAGARDRLAERLGAKERALGAAENQARPRGLGPGARRTFAAGGR